MHNYKSMMASIFILGSDCNTMISLCTTAYDKHHCTNVFIIGWEVHNYKSMMARIFLLSSDCKICLDITAQRLLMISNIAKI